MLVLFGGYLISWVMTEYKDLPNEHWSILNADASSPQYTDLTFSDDQPTGYITRPNVQNNPASHITNK